MKKSLLLFAFILLLLPSLKSQGDFAPVGATWYFRSFLMSSPTNWSYRKFTSAAELVYNGHLCRHIIRFEPLNIYGNPDPFYVNYYVYTDSNRVYYATGNNWAILYDFNKNAGESWINTASGITVFVDSTATTQICGKTLKKMLIHNSNSMWVVFGGWITEEIGWDNNLFPVWGDSAPPEIGYLKCYEDDSLSLVLESPCDEIIMARDDLTANTGFHIFPNPAMDYLQVERADSRKAEIEISDIRGVVRMKNTVTSSQSINISVLTPGVYLVKIISDQPLCVQKLIKL